MAPEADFADGTSTGALTNFVAQETGKFGGTLEIGTGTITGDDLSADVTGQITLPAQIVEVTHDFHRDLPRRHGLRHRRNPHRNDKCRRHLRGSGHGPERHFEEHGLEVVQRHR